VSNGIKRRMARQKMFKRFVCLPGGKVDEPKEKGGGMTPRRGEAQLWGGFVKKKSRDDHASKQNDPRDFKRRGEIAKLL